MGRSDRRKQLPFGGPGQSRLCIAVRVVGSVQQSAVKLGEAVAQSKPRQSALAVNVEGRRKVLRCLKRRCVKVHATGIVIRFKSHRRPTGSAKMPQDPFGTGKCARCVACPCKVLCRHAEPCNDRSRAVSSAIIAVAIASPRLIAGVFPSCSLTQTVTARCHLVFSRLPSV